MLSRPTGRSLLPGVLAIALSVATAAGPGARATDEVPVQDLGRFIINAQTGGPFVGTVHAVQVTDSATIVYYSVGTRAGRALLPPTNEHAFIGYGHDTEFDPAVADASLRLLRVIDPGGRKVYRPLTTPKHPVCVCTPIEDFPPWDFETEVLTVAAVLPRLPDNVTTVDVDVNGAGAVVTGIPVTRGEAFTPTTGSGGPVIMGTGWPVLDLADAATVQDPAPFITDLIEFTETTDAAQRQQTTSTTTQISVSTEVLFDVNKDVLTARAQEQLARVAEQIETNGQGPVTVVGHADSDGSDAHNLDLSKRRAAAVVAALTPLLPGVQFIAGGKGESEPVAPNDTPVNRSLNRRVEITFATREER